MARFYSNENIAAQVVAELRRLGHDVLTSLDAGKANAAVPDTEVLAFAVAASRILLSHNRRHFLRLSGEVRIETERVLEGVRQYHGVGWHADLMGGGVGWWRAASGRLFVRR